MGERTANVQDADFAAIISELSDLIHKRSLTAPQGSYTAKLLSGSEDSLLKKIAEEASEVIMAAKDRDHDHLRYEMADLLYHLLVVAERWNISLPELAGELYARRPASSAPEKEVV